MSTRLHSLVFAACAALCALIPATASAATTAAASPAEIVEQQRQIAARLDDDGAGLDKRAVADVRREQARVFAIVDGKDTFEDLTLEEKINLRNALESIDAQLKATALAEDDSEVCRREHQLGSRFKVTRCRTRAAMREERSSGQAMQGSPRICGKGEPGCLRD